jgi:hypothetical protein
VKNIGGTRRSSSVLDWEVWIAASGFAVLTMVLTYPQIRFMQSQIGMHYDALFSVWRLAWLAHQAPHDPLHLFDANIFYPSLKTLAYSDALLLPGLIGAPLVWIGVHSVLVHNLLILLSFIASGVAMYILVRTVTGSAWAAWFSGAVFAFQPYRFAHYSQLELLWGWWIPLALWALHRMLTRHRVRDGALLGLFVALQAWSCIYYAVFLVTAVAIVTIVMACGWSRSQILELAKPALAAALVCGILIGPYSVPYVEAQSTVNTRSESEIREWSPTLLNYLAAPAENWLYGRTTPRVSQTEGIMFPGLCAIILAAIGLFPPNNRRHIAYAVLLIVAVDMSLGFNGLTYRGLYSALWPYQRLRVPARMFVVVSVVLAALGGEGVSRLLDRIKTPLARRFVGSALVGLVLAESVSAPLKLQRIAPSPPAVYRWLRSQPPAVIMEWPLPLASSLGVTEAPLYMYYSTFHWQPLVNGYSGYYPQSYIRFLDAVWTFPQPETIRYLQRLGVGYVILHSQPDPERYQELRDVLRSVQDLKLVLTDDRGPDRIAVYQLQALSRAISQDRSSPAFVRRFQPG